MAKKVQIMLEELNETYGTECKTIYSLKWRGKLMVYQSLSPCLMFERMIRRTAGFFVWIQMVWMSLPEISGILAWPEWQEESQSWSTTQKALLSQWWRHHQPSCCTFWKSMTRKMYSASKMSWNVVSASNGCSSGMEVWVYLKQLKVEMFD